MIYDFGLSWRAMRAHPVQTLIPACVVALAIALSVAVFALSDGIRRGLILASDPFGVLVIGAKGDSQQLALNTILLQGLPLGTIPYTTYETLAADSRVQLAVPLAKGDNIGGAPMIGTNASFFQLRRSLNAPLAFQLLEGELFDADFEAVLGSRAARSLGLRVGDEFQAAHGFRFGLAGDTHEAHYTVVGILEPSQTPYDGAVYTTVGSIWKAHEETELPTNNVIDSLSREQAGADERLTSVLVLPVGFIEQNQLMQEYYLSTDAQAVAPGEQIGGLFDLLRQGERVLGAVGYLVLGMAALTVFLALYSVTLTRQQDVAIMRSLGGSRVSVFRMVLFEALFITLIGALLGRVLGYLAAFLIGAFYTQQSAIPIPIRYLMTLEPVLWVLPLSVGILAGLLPAARAYRVDIVEKLFPS
ncbi:MAG: FtsX-like permease family protein [bacterium]|nr:FtsX-like permease family protein [bacterium]